MAIRIDIQTSEIEFDFAGETVIANASDENIAKMLKMKDGDLQKQAEDEAKKIASMDEENISTEEFERLVEICVDLYGQIYAPVFGEDAFKRVYDHIQSIHSTMQGFEQALDHITNEIEKRDEKMTNDRQKKIDKYKKRKKK